MTGAAGMNLNRSMLVGEDLRYGSPAPGPAPVGFPFSPQAMSSPQQQQTRMPYSPYGQQQQFAQSPGAGMMMQHYDAGDLNAEIRYGNRLWAMDKRMVEFPFLPFLWHLLTLFIFSAVQFTSRWSWKHANNVAAISDHLLLYSAPKRGPHISLGN